MTLFTDYEIVKLTCEDLSRRLQGDTIPIDKVPWAVTYVANENDYPFKHLDVLTDDRRRKLSIEVVRTLLSQGAILGSLSADPKRFLDPWPGSPDEVLNRFIEAWDKAGKCPDEYEIWIGFTPDRRAAPLR